jgi:hypothetical protein
MKTDDVDICQACETHDVDIYPIRERVHLHKVLYEGIALLLEGLVYSKMLQDTFLVADKELQTF